MKLTRQLSPADLQRTSSQVGEQMLGSLAVPLTPIIGREHELMSACELLRSPEVRLLTLVGPAGVGKTRLGIEIARRLRPDFPDGVYSVALASLSSADQVIPAIGLVLGIRESSEQPLIDTIRQTMRDKQVLLLLDNFEHVTAAAPHIVEILATSARLKVLITSRAAAHVRGEQAFPVPPLAVPDSSQRDAVENLDELACISAVALFVQRAQGRHSTFQLTPANARDIAEICYRLEGLPLAIELAASRITLLSPPVLLKRLEHRLDVLTQGPRDLPLRQQTLRSTLAWSYDLLTAEEQYVFRTLAVFSGGATLAALEAVCDAVCDAPSSPHPQLDVFQCVSSLLDQHLAQRIEDADSSIRIGMLETLREYALEQLAASGDFDLTRREHALYYVRLAEEAGPHFTQADQKEWFVRTEREHDNMRAALQWALDCAEPSIGLRLGSSLWLFWQTQGHLREGQHWLETFLALRNRANLEEDAPQQTIRAKALTVAGVFASMQGQHTLARERYEQGLALHRALDDPRGIAAILNNLSILERHQANYVRAEELQQESLELRRAIGDTLGIATSLANLGSLAELQGDLERAAAILEEGLLLQHSIGNTYGVTGVLVNLGNVALRMRDYSRAGAVYDECLTLQHDLGDKRGVAEIFEALAEIACARALFEHAITLWGAASAIRESIGATMPADDQQKYARNVEKARASLPEQQFAALWETGYTKPLEQAIHETHTAYLPAICSQEQQKRAHPGASANQG